VTPGPRRRHIAADACAALLLAGLPWLLYSGALDLWWTEDDFFQLQYALGHAPGEYAFDPDVWRRLPNRVLSPLLFVSYDLDLALFGLSTTAFYAHQLVSVGLAGAVLFLVLRLWLPVAWSFLGGSLFLLGPPIASLPPLLMVRHYPEAVVLGLLAVGAFVLAIRRRGATAALLTLVSALLYLAASTAKEIALPLPALLAVLPAGGPRRRILLLTPHAAVASLYVVYRTWMLGTPFGGYGWAAPPGDWPGVLAALPAKLARELAGPSGWGWAALLAIALPVSGCLVRSPAVRALCATGLLVAWLPIAPVSIEMKPRLALASWLLVAVAFALATRRLAAAGPGRGVVAFLVAFVCLAAFASNRSAWSQYLGQAQRKSVENRGYLELGRGDFLRHPASSPPAMAELDKFARNVLGRPVEGGWFYDDLFLCRGPGAPGRAGKRPVVESLWTFDRQAMALTEITSRLPSLRRVHCASTRRQAPLEASFRALDGGILLWSLGPRHDGRYAFVMAAGRLRYDVPREGGFRLGARDGLTLRVRYEAPSGRVTYSPRLSVDLEPGSSSVWRRRKGDGPPDRPAEPAADS
jgi:hypothetical protein